jgi:imidazolonepropionase-like amidohydrolase
MRRYVLFLFIFSAIGVAGPATLAQAPQVPVTVIRAGKLIDPATGQVTINQSIVVTGNRITSVGAIAEVHPGVAYIDLSQSTVMPGVMDMHTHMCMDVVPERDHGNYYLTTLFDPDSLRSVEGLINAKSMLEAGFTTIRDVGNEGNYACSSVRQVISQGRTTGPTIFNAGRIIAPYGGQFQLQPGRPNLGEPEYAFADTRDEMVKAIRENLHYGALVIKIVVDDQRYIYSPEDIKFMIDEAARGGAKLAAHVWTTQGAHNAAVAGVASMEHLNGVADADLETAKKNGVTAVFTPFPIAALDMFRNEPGSGKEEFAQEIDRLKAGRKVGIPIAFGSDAIMELPGKTRGQTTMEWTDSYVTAGFTPAELLKAMTVTPAKLLGLESRVGAIKAGMLADIIAMPANPLDNPQALKQVNFVMKGGKVIVK